MPRTIPGFEAADWALFGITLAASTGVGLFYALRSRKHESPDEMLLGGKHMPIIPTALSLLTSFLSGVTLLGMPLETYQKGALFWFSRLIGTQVSVWLAIIVVLPIFFHLQPTSVYQYLEARFHSRLLRIIGSSLYLIYMLAYMGVVLYGPSVALSGVTGIPAWIFFVVVGLICMGYTSIGGLKAVVWTDSLQAAFMIAGVLTLFFKGAVDGGGLVKAFNTAVEYGRFEGFHNLSLNPFQYMTLWTSIFGGIGFWLSLLTFNQISVQRYLSMASVRDARKVLLLNIPGYMIFCTLADLSGIIIFNYYFGCDPIRSSQLEKNDQLVIYYALDILGSVPGLPGIFLACLFSGTLSTVSSGINSMSAVLYEDFIDIWPKFHNLTASRQSFIIKMLAVISGLLSIALAFASGPIGGIISTMLSVMGAVGGPLVGIFLLGMLFPFANYYGALVGLIVSMIITFWIALGEAITKPYANYELPLFANDCQSQRWNLTSFVYKNYTATSQYAPGTGIQYLYGLSPILYPFLGLTLVLLIGIPTSLVLKDKREKSDDMKLNIFGHLSCTRKPTSGESTNAMFHRKKIYTVQESKL